MNIKNSYAFAGIFLFSGVMGRAQGTFQNLDFEEANVVPIVGSPFYPYGIAVANALPDWTVEYGNMQQSQMTYNDPSLGGTAAILIADGYQTITTATALDGNFSVELYGGLTPASISQTGQIPPGTQSLLFEWGGSSLAQPEVFIGNDSLALFPVKSGVYGANISAWSGQVEQLTITVPAGFGPYEFDDISFSPGAVPEPNPFALAAIGTFLFGLYRRFFGKSK